VSGFRWCLRCGDPLPAGSRSDARYCSTACRVAAHRARTRNDVTPVLAGQLDIWDASE